MTYRQVKFQDLLHHLRRKYEGDQRHTDMLNRILWYSYPIVLTKSTATQAENVRQARASQKYRCNKRLKQMANEYSHLFFVTLTFRDDVLEKTSDRTRHRYVSKFLNDNTLDYVANVDYGSKTNREHYHAVVALDGKKTALEWAYGFASYKPCKMSTIKKAKGNCKIAKYLTKMSNHATKLTAGRVFSKARKKPSAVVYNPYTEEGRRGLNFIEINENDELPF